MHSSKVIITLWVRWKKPKKSALTLDPEDVESAEDLECTAGRDIYAKLKGLFNNLMIGGNIKEMIQRIFVYIMMQMENLCLPGSGFMLDQIMHLHINFHKLALT